MQEQGATTAGNGSRQLIEASKQVAHDASNLGDSLNELAGRARESVATMLHERPYVVLGAAAAIGYLVAGGMASRLTRVAIGLGGRMLVQRAIGQMTANVEGENF